MSSPGRAIHWEVEWLSTRNLHRGFRTSLGSSQTSPDSLLTGTPRINCDSFPWLCIYTTIGTLKKSPVVSPHYLALGYWQFEFKESDKALTAFTIPTGLYALQTMLFGMPNTFATFHFMMMNVLAGLMSHQFSVYLDDIIIYSQDHDTHLWNLLTIKQRVWNTEYVEM